MSHLIAKITDEDLGLPKNDLNDPIIRYGARGIVFNDDGKVVVFHKKNKNEYKLPGGGIEENETGKEAFRREVMEEAGCKISNIKKIGITIEEKGQTNFRQLSEVFISRLINDTHSLHLTKKERDEGGEMLWLPLEDAYKKVSSSIDKVIGSKYDDKYRTLFMVKRDAMILEYVCQLQKNKVHSKLNKKRIK